MLDRGLVSGNFPRNATKDLQVGPSGKFPSISKFNAAKFGKHTETHVGFFFRRVKKTILINYGVIRWSLTLLCWYPRDLTGTNKRPCEQFHPVPLSRSTVRALVGCTDYKEGCPDGYYFRLLTANVRYDRMSSNNQIAMICDGWLSQCQ